MMPDHMLFRIQQNRCGKSRPHSKCKECVLEKCTLFKDVLKRSNKPSNRIVPQNKMTV
jgi:hypothetical protein